MQNERFCGDKGSLGAKCFYDQSDAEETYSKQEWDDLRFGWICAAPDTFARRQAALLKFCEKTKKCKKEDIKNIKDINLKVKRLI